jgi:hypothetical protein
MVKIVANNGSVVEIDEQSWLTLKGFIWMVGGSVIINEKEAARKVGYRLLHLIENGAIKRLLDVADFIFNRMCQKCFTPGLISNGNMKICGKCGFVEPVVNILTEAQIEQFANFCIDSQGFEVVK